MTVRKADIYFSNDFKGVLEVANGQVAIGGEQGTLAPYDLLFGALASCLYATFLDVVRKKRIHFYSAHIEVTGEKQTTVPTVLTWVNTKITIKGAEAKDQAAFTKSFDLATQYCSIYQTISKVAEMSWSVEFED
ncbi:MAG: OsmC family protein [Clostridia bacterium]|nr:OsmC family protein [Clostridia bacterium]